MRSKEIPVSKADRDKIRKSLGLTSSEVKAQAKTGGIDLNKHYEKLKERLQSITYLNKAQRKLVREVYKKSQENIVAEAKAKRIPVKSYYRTLYQIHGSNLVTATFRLWYEDKPEENRDDTKWTKKVFDGTTYFCSTSNLGKGRVVHYREYTLVLPKALAKTWIGSDEVSELARELKNDARNFSFANGYLGIYDGQKVFELVSEPFPYKWNGTETLPDPKTELNKNTFRAMISPFRYTKSDKKGEVTNWMSPEVYEELKNTLLEQYKVRDNTLSDLCGPYMIIDTIAEHHNNYIRTLKPTENNLKKLITIESIAKDLGYTQEELQKYGTSWDMLLPLFEKYKLPAVQFNIQAVKEAEYVPEVARRNHEKLVFIRHDGHFWLISGTYEKQSLCQQNLKVICQKPLLNIFPKPPDFKKSFGSCVKTFEQLRLSVFYSQETYQVYFWRGGNFYDNVVKVFVDNNVVPTELFLNDTKEITGCSFPYGTSVKVTINSFDVPDTPKNADLKRELDGLSDEQWVKVYEFNEMSRKQMLNKSTKSGVMSQYHDSFREVFQFLGVPRVGMFDFPPEDVQKAIDMNWCYPNAIMNLKKIPVFTVFDTLQVYDGHPIEDYTIYVYKGGACYGMFLNFEVEILSFVRPAQVKSNKLKETINIICSSDLPRRVRKYLAVIAIGRLGKANNKRNNGYLYHTLNEALRHSQGPHSEILVRNVDKWKLLSENDSGPYLLRNFSHVNLVEGFIPIQMLIYGYVSWQFRNKKRSLENQGITVWGQHLDSLFISKEDSKKVKTSNEKEWKDRGNYKMEDVDVSEKRLMKPLKNKDVILIPATETKKRSIRLLDEFGDEFYYKIFFWKGNIVITSVYPGSGKTTMALRYCKLFGGTYIVACATKDQVEKVSQEHPAKTLYGLCGGKVGTENDLSNTESYDLVVVDEVFMHNITSLCMLLRYMKRNPKTRFIATGDLFQTKPIEDSFNPSQKEWYKKAVDFMFPTSIELQVPKRLKFPQRDLPKLYKLKYDLFEAKANLQTVVREFGTELSLSSWLREYELSTVLIAYTNETRHKINMAVHKHLGYSEEQYFITGQKYICKCRSDTLNINCSYILKHFDCEKIEWINVLTNENICIKRMTNKKNGKIEDKLVKENFSLPYCKTGHACQGATYDNKVIVFDVLSGYPDANWTYVAETRVTDFDNIYYVLNPSVKLDYFEVRTKIGHYKQQDADRFRNSDYKWKPEDYITAKDIFELSKSQCHMCALCHQVMNFKNKKGDSANNWSLDRKNDSFAHVKGNCHLAHLSCNVGRSDEPVLSF